MEDLATSECEEQIEILEDDWQDALKEMQTYMDIGSFGASAVL